MKLVFRVRYHTVPSQSLWLQYSLGGDTGPRFEQIIPMRWRDRREWETEVEIVASGAFRLEYHYQLRQENNGVVLDEWKAPRVASVDPDREEALVFLDTWCSAGTVDYAFESSAFLAVLPERGPFQERPSVPGANHLFQLRMTAVPANHAPCVLGSVSELGDWDWNRAVTLREVEANVWQAHVYLPPDWHIEYKYGIRDLESDQVVGFETGENRRLDAAREVAESQQVRIGDEGFGRSESGLFRGTGVALPVFSLRSAEGLGVGEFADLKAFGDWANTVGMKLIQILPVNDTSARHDWTDSYPYSAISTFALHPLYLRIDDLDHDMPPEFSDEVRATREHLNVLGQVDYEGVMTAKRKFLKEIFEAHRPRILKDPAFLAFVADNRGWLVPYAAFCVKRDHFHTPDFERWAGWAKFDPDRVESMMQADHAEWPGMAYHLWVQFELDRQFTDAVGHLHHLGLALKGDLPIGIDRHSVDAWSAPHLFKMKSQAGAPPDAFAVKGQNWTFPTYDWEAMERENFKWWRSRFSHLSRYFDAYRIDHILGFFRIWQVPLAHVEGIMGFFDPAVPIEVSEFAERGIDFSHERFCVPYIREHFLRERFGDATDEVKALYLEDQGDDRWKLREVVSNQRKIMEQLGGPSSAATSNRDVMREGLLDCASEVLFFEVDGSERTLYHPRGWMQTTKSYQELDDETRGRVEELYIDYFYRRQEAFWQARGYEKLPAMRAASPMLLCGEDLGMVPACVPGVLRELGILSLEIQRMPKEPGAEFFNPAHAPYMSVVSTSTHDMSPLRAWWREDQRVTARFAWQMFGIAFPPADLTAEVAIRIIDQHLRSPAMWAVLPLQDLLAIDEALRFPVPEAERINVPAIIPFNWRYRMHLDLSRLSEAEHFNARLAELVRDAGR